MVVSSNRFNRIRREVQELERELELDNQAIRLAKEKQDLSENTEYDAAMASKRSHQSKLDSLNEILLKAKVITPGTTIGVGTLLRIQETDSSHNLIGEPRLFMMEEIGETITDGVLNTKSPLGREIYNKSSGHYSIKPSTITKHFQVTILDSSADFEEYERCYPLSKQELFRRIFEGEDDES